MGELLMQYVIVQPQRDAYWIDPSAYLEVLPSLAESLPPGAREFALQPGHYDFSSTTCVKNLGFQSLTIDDAGDSASLCFRPGIVSHDEGLTLAYAGLVSVAVDREEDPGAGWLGTVFLDELRPHPEGVVHEFAMTGGSMTLVAGDVRATWGAQATG